MSLAILLVEDNPDNRALAGLLLRRAGYRVLEAASAAEALAAAAAERVDGVLLDLALPGRGGLEALPDLRAALRPGTPVVALTAHAMKGDEERARAAGLDGYMTKPIRVATFVSSVRAALGGAFA